MTFKVGDRVVAIGIDHGFSVGERGVVVRASAESTSVGVSFDAFSTKRHNCGCRCEDGHGWNCDVIDLMLDDANQEPPRKKREW